MAALALLAVAATSSAQNPAANIVVDANLNRKSINPAIYGVSYGSAADVSDLNVPLNRQVSVDAPSADLHCLQGASVARLRCSCAASFGYMQSCKCSMLFCLTVSACVPSAGRQPCLQVQLAGQCRQQGL